MKKTSKLKNSSSVTIFFLSFLNQLLFIWIFLVSLLQQKFLNQLYFNLIRYRLENLSIENNENLPHYCSRSDLHAKCHRWNISLQWMPFRKRLRSEPQYIGLKCAHKRGVNVLLDVFIFW